MLLNIILCKARKGLIAHTKAFGRFLSCAWSPHTIGIEPRASRSWPAPIMPVMAICCTLGMYIRSKWTTFMHWVGRLAFQIPINDVLACHTCAIGMMQSHIAMPLCDRLHNCNKLNCFLWHDCFPMPFLITGHTGDWTQGLPHAKRVWCHYTMCPWHEN